MSFPPTHQPLTRCHFSWLFSFMQILPLHVIVILRVECESLTFRRRSHLVCGVPRSLPQEGDSCSGHCLCTCSPMGTATWLSIPAFHFEMFILQMAAGVSMLVLIFRERCCTHQWTKLSFMPMSTSELEAKFFQYERLFMQLLSGILFALITAIPPTPPFASLMNEDTQASIHKGV